MPAAVAESRRPRRVTAKERVLAAAEECIKRYGPEKTSMEDVAFTAGVSRTTLYRYFRNRDELLMAVAEGTSAELASEAIGYLMQFNDVDDWLVEGLLFALHEIPKRPVLNALLTSYEARSSSQVVLRSERFMQIGVGVLQPMFRQAQSAGILRDGLDINMLIEWVIRILWTYLHAPSAANDDSMRRLFRMMLLPAVLRDGRPARPTLV